MKKRILTIILGILCTAGMHGQSSDVPSLPQLTTPSPKATMVDRFGYYVYGAGGYYNSYSYY